MVSGYPRRLGLRGFQAGFSCNPRILPLLLQDPLFLGLRLSYDDSASSPRTPSHAENTQKSLIPEKVVCEQLYFQLVVVPEEFDFSV